MTIDEKISREYNPDNLRELFGMKKYFIAYFDILGFENFINQDDKYKDLKLLYTINDIIANSRMMASYFTKADNLKEIKLKVFSDNFLYCTEENYLALISLVSCLQSAFITCNLIIRGSLCYGDLVFNNEFLYGKGLINAYKIESEIAIFPRIVIDESFFIGAQKMANQIYKKDLSRNELLDTLDNFFCTDFDNNKFINYLGAVDNLTIDKTSGSYGFIEVLKDHAITIKNGLLSSDKKVLQKYQWCKTYHNKICKQYQHDALFID
jgi:hypothetical protein